MRLLRLGTIVGLDWLAGLLRLFSNLEVFPVSALDKDFEAFGEK